MVRYLPAYTPFGFAHRGGNEVAPENTVEAFAHAFDLGFRHLETDVHLTADGVLVAFHDADLERVAGRSGSIDTVTWNELATIDLGGGHRIPRLAELFDAFPEARFNIEPKADAAVEPLVRTLREFDAVDRVGIGSFSDQRIAAVRSLLGVPLFTSPGPRGLLATGLTSWLRIDRWWRPARPVHQAVQIPAKIGPLPLTRFQVDRFHRLGLQVHVWTVNEADEMEHLFDLGVDAVMSDKISVLAEVLRRRGRRPDGSPLDPPPATDSVQESP